MRRQRILFLNRRRNHYWGHRDGSELSSGLKNSVTFIIDMMLGLGLHAKMVEVPDNNAIDREVTLYKPSHVVIEALWVTVDKIDILKRLHPEVHWIVRLHSEVPFLAHEGIAVQWISGYLRRGVEIMCNSTRLMGELRSLTGVLRVSDSLVSFGPNVYPAPARRATIPRPEVEGGALHIGCFGAIRPLKNHLAQAIAALVFADHNVKLRFHINAPRIEGGGDPVLKNLRALFAATPRHELVEHPWLSHREFLDLLGKMDLAMQVSFSETFNIVAADAVDCGIPVVVSAEIGWLGSYAHASPNSTESMVEALHLAWEGHRRHRLAQQARDLSEYTRAAEQVWAERFGARPIRHAPEQRR